MKKIKRLVVISMMLISTLSLAQSKTNHRFTDINLNEIRKTVLKNLRSDELIGRRFDKIYLVNRETGIWVNEHKLEGTLHTKYENLLAEYKVGKGQDRAVFISKDCTAVGDFLDNSFHGKAKGRLRIEYTSNPLPGEL